MDARVDHSEVRVLTHQEARLIVFGMLLPVFMGSLDNTILASALPTIGRDFGDSHSLPWLITIYLLASTAVVPLYGKISDIHGRRFTLRIAICDLHGRLAAVRAGAEYAGADPRPRAARARRWRARFHGRGRAGRRRRTEGAWALLRLFRGDLHHRRCVRTGAGRLPFRVYPLVGDLLAQHPARDRGADRDQCAAAPAAAARPSAPPRRDRRRADRHR